MKRKEIRRLCGWTTGDNPAPRSDHDMRTSIENAGGVAARGRRPGMTVMGRVQRRRRQLRWRDTTRCAPSEAAAEPPLLSAPPNLDDGFETPGPFAHPRRPDDSPEHTQGTILGTRSVPPYPALPTHTRSHPPPSPHSPHLRRNRLVRSHVHKVRLSASRPVFTHTSLCPHPSGRSWVVKSVVVRTKMTTSTSSSRNSYNFTLS
jgi:hypothetical protein